MFLKSPVSLHVSMPHAFQYRNDFIVWTCILMHWLRGIWVFSSLGLWSIKFTRTILCMCVELNSHFCWEIPRSGISGSCGRCPSSKSNSVPAFTALYFDKPRVIIQMSHMFTIPWHYQSFNSSHSF